MMEQPHKTFLDKAHLLRLFQGDESRVRELVKHALVVTLQSANVLQGFLREGEESNFLKELHKIKGSLGVIEPAILYPDALKLEEEFKSSNRQESKEHAKNFIADVMILCREMEAFVG